MDKLRCNTCGAHSMIPMEVAIEEDPNDTSVLFGHEPESRFYTCHVCGDNWLSVKEKEGVGHCKITFVHQMGMSPVLKRIAHTHSRVVFSEEPDEDWTYFLDDQEIDQEVWLDKLSKRRRVLRAICTN